MISKREENRYISRKFVCPVLTHLQGASILLRPNVKYIEHPDLFHTTCHLHVLSVERARTLSGNTTFNRISVPRTQLQMSSNSRICTN